MQALVREVRILVYLGVKLVRFNFKEFNGVRQVLIYSYINLTTNCSWYINKDERLAERTFSSHEYQSVYVFAMMIVHLMLQSRKWGHTKPHFKNPTSPNKSKFILNVKSSRKSSRHTTTVLKIVPNRYLTRPKDPNNIYSIDSLSEK